MTAKPNRFARFLFTFVLAIGIFVAAIYPVTVSHAAGGFEISKHASAGTIYVDQPLTYTLRFTDTTGANVIATITDTIPANTTVVRIGQSSNGGPGTMQAGEIEWIVGIDNGQTMVVSFTVIATRSGVIINDNYRVSSADFDGTGTPVTTTVLAAPMQIISFSPPLNSHTIPFTTPLSVSYNQPISPTTVSTRTFAVHAMQSGLLTQTYAISGGTISLAPSSPFKPGELVQVSATTGTLNVNGQGPISPTVWQFRAAVERGSGVFVDSGQSLGNSVSWAVDIGDLDGDGDLDAFEANLGLSTGQANRVWLNNGAGAFSDSGQLLGNSQSHGVTLGDVDSDGDLDAFVVNVQSPTGEVWLNNGTGTFSDSGQALGNSRGTSVGLGDIDGDGDLDAFITTNSGNQVWVNDGAGIFTMTQILGSSNSYDVSLEDLDGDGDLDAFVANDGNPNQVWLNDGTGHFSDSGQSLGNARSVGMALGDVDGDGDLDAFVANILDQANKVWLNDGTGVFSDSGQSLGSSWSSTVSLGDVDGDGDLDAFVANSNVSSEANTVWLNDGAGIFSDSGQSLGNSGSSSVELGDLDGDGDLDAFVTNNNSQPDKVWLNQNLQPVLTITKIAPLTVIANHPITFTLTITNSGNLTATNLIITDTLPAGASYVSGGTYVGNVVSWTANSLPPNTATQVSFVVTATATITNRDYGVRADGGVSAQGNQAVVTTIQNDPPANLTWVFRANMPTGRQKIELPATSNGKLYAIGGEGGIGCLALDDVEEYNPATNTWAIKANMPTPRWASGSATVADKIYIIGGAPGCTFPINTVEEYDPATDTWRTRASMLTSRHSLGTAEHNGKIYVIGGIHGINASDISSTVEEYDPTTNTWATRASMPTARVGLGAVTASNGRIYAIGGANGVPLATVEEYDPVANTWRTRASMPTARWALSVVTLNNKIYAIGGYVNSGTTGEVNIVEEYDPATDTWQTSTSTNLTHAFAGANVSGNKIYVVGGGVDGSAVEEGAFYSTFTELHLSKHGPPTVLSNEPITYTLTITNSGNLTATNLVITDTIPTGANYVSGGTKVGNVVSWTVPSLSPNNSASVQFSVTATQTITNYDYRVSADGGYIAMGRVPVTTTVTFTDLLTDCQTPLFSDDFSGNLAAWEVSQGTWSIDNGELKGIGAGGAVDAWIYAGDTAWNNYVLSTTVDFDDGNAELVVRSTGHWQNEYRVSLWSPDSSQYANRYQIRRYKGGESVALTDQYPDSQDGNVPSPVLITDPARVQVKVVDNTLTLYINGAMVDAVTDTDPLWAGRAGLGVIWSWTGHFDDVAVFGCAGGTMPGLTISKIAPLTAVIDQPITYTLTITNSGAATATNLVITDSLPIGASYVSGGTRVGNVVSWMVAALPPTTATQVSFVATATATITNWDYGVRADGSVAARGNQAVVTTIQNDPPANLTWVFRANMPTGRQKIELPATSNGKLYAIGGEGGIGCLALDDVEEYNPATNTWAIKANMPTPRWAPGSATVADKIYIIGGAPGCTFPINTVEEYDPATDTWRTRASMPTSRHRLGTAEHNGKIYVIGGIDGTNFLSTVEEYDPVANTWRTRASMPTARWGAGAVTASNGKIYAIGGGNGVPLSTVEEYDPVANTWLTRASMPTPRWGLSVVAVNNRVYAIGGYINSGTTGEVNIVEEYDPATDTWQTSTSTNLTHALAGANVSGNKIYVVGGGVDGSVVEEGTFNSTFAELQLTKHGPATVFSNQPITYTLAVTNSGNLTATNLVITDAIPAGANYVSGGTKVGNVVSWTVAALPPNTATQVSFVVTTTETITNRDYGVQADGGVSAQGNQAVVTTISNDLPDHVVIAAQPQLLMVGNSAPLTLTVYDGLGHVTPNSPITVTTTIGTILPTAVGTTSASGVLTRSIFSTQAGVASLAVTSENGQLSASGDITVTYLPDAPLHVTLVASPTQILADGLSTALITVTVTDIYANPVAGFTPALTTTHGTLLDSGATNAAGQTTRRLRSTTQITTASVNVIGFVAAPAQVEFVSGQVHSAMLETIPNIAYVWGLGTPSTMTLVITVTNQAGQPLANQTMTVQTSIGTLTGCTDTNVNGSLTCLLQSTVAGHSVITVNGVTPIGDTPTFLPGETAASITLLPFGASSAPVTVTAGVPITFAAVARDAYGNTIPSATFLWGLRDGSPSGYATISDQGMMIGQKSGQMVVWVQSNKGGYAESHVNITPGSPVKGELAATPKTVSLDAVSALTLTIKDRYDNIIDSYFCPQLISTIGTANMNCTSTGVALGTITSISQTGTAVLSITNLSQLIGDTTVIFIPRLEADLAIQKYGPAAAVQPGAPITYTLTITNSGTAPANNLVITDTIPAGASYVSGGTKVGNIVSWTVASLPVSATTQVSFVVTATETITNQDYAVSAEDGYYVTGAAPVVTRISSGPPFTEQPCTLYGVHDDGEKDSQLFIADLQTMAFAPLGPLRVNYDIEGLDAHPASGELYGAGGNQPGGRGPIYHADKASGHLTLLGYTGYGDLVAASFRPTDNTLWFTAQPAGQLLSVDVADVTQPTLHSSEIGNVEALAWNPGGNLLYAAHNRSLYVYDPADSGFERVCANKFPGITEGLEFRPDGVLVGSSHQHKGGTDYLNLFTFDIEDCAIIDSSTYTVPYFDVESFTFGAQPCGIFQPRIGTLAGQVTAPDSTPLISVTVTAYQFNNNWWDEVASTRTDAAGDYSMKLGEGIYQIHFDPTRVYNDNYLAEYFNNTKVISQATQVTVYAGSTTVNIDAVLETPPPPAAQVDGNVSQWADPQTGAVNLWAWNGSSMTINRTVTCDSGTPTAVTLRVGSQSFPMSEAPSGSGQFSISMTAALGGDLSTQGVFGMNVTWDCNGQPDEVTIGQIEVRLFDPSGQITDAASGQPIEGATVTLYRVPGAFPDTATETRHCRTVDTRAGNDWNGEPASEADAGLPVNPDLFAINGTQEISPTVNPQITGSDGRYAWDVVEGCWYVVVTASGYPQTVSPLVGVPPEVTDLDLTLSALAKGTNVYLPVIIK